MRDLRHGHGRRIVGGDHLDGALRRRAATIDEGTVDTRLRRSADIRATYSRGKRFQGDAARVHARQRGDDLPARWTVVAGRQVGSATARNRAKRRLRAIVAGADVPNGVDMVVVAGPDAVTTPAAVLAKEVRRLVALASERAEARR